MANPNWKKGISGNPNGRPRGVENNNSEFMAMRRAWLDAFLNFQDGGPSSLVEWGRSNPTDFYKLAMRLIPAQAEVSVDVTSDGQAVRGWTVYIPDATENLALDIEDSSHLLEKMETPKYDAVRADEE